MKINIIQVGRTKAAYLREAEEEYLKRLKPYADVRTITVKEGTSGGLDPAQVIEKEASVIIKAIPDGTFVVALDENGSQMTSIDLARQIKKNRDFEGGNITFITGGCYGLAHAVLGHAGLKLSFGRFTYTHEVIRMLLLEQLYRSFMINAGRRYHY